MLAESAQNVVELPYLQGAGVSGVLIYAADKIANTIRAHRNNRQQPNARTPERLAVLETLVKAQDKQLGAIFAKLDALSDKLDSLMLRSRGVKPSDEP